jgi:hypothetical protein
MRGESGVSQATLAPLEAPPKEIPTAVLVSSSGRQAGITVASRWATQDGQALEQLPQEAIRWPDSGWVEKSSGATIELSTSVMPARVELRMFSDVDSETGIPAGTGDSAVCQTRVIQGTACSVRIADEKVQVVLPEKIESYLVVYAEWYVPSEMRTQEAPATQSVSWGFHRP